MRMKAVRAVFMAAVGIACLAASRTSDAEPVLESFRVDPDRLCLRDTFRWGFSYRGLPGGLAAVKDVEIWALWDGPGEQPIRSLLAPARLHDQAADQGRFESHTLHFAALRRAPGEIHYTLRVVLADGRELSSKTSVRYMDSCPPGGVSIREDRWADELRRVGVATFVLDTFTGRGITFTAEDQAQLSSLAMIGDAYRALELMATHPRIDPARITVMGFSKGAVPALYSALIRFQRLYGPPGIRFAQHIAFYPRASSPTSGTRR